MASPAHSSLVILVPAARPVAGKERRRLDRKASWAIPLHITVLFPFAAPAAVSQSTVARIAGVCRRHPTFVFQLDRVGWFDDRVMYLAPDPAEPFVALTEALAAEFPEYPPYDGAYQDVIPHLTVGEGARPVRMRRAARRLERRLPIGAEATEVSLIAPDDSGRWDVVHGIPLGPSHL